MNPTEPVGFDLDLTLIDSRPAILAAWSAVAAETGTPVDLAAVDTRMGVKLEDEAAFWFPPGRVDYAAAVYRRHYVQLAPRLTTVLPGAHEAMAAVRRAGLRAVIITAKHPASAGPSLEMTGLRADELFTHVHGPEKALVLARIGASAYVGDSPADMAAAVTAGVCPVGVPTGSFSADALLAAGAGVVLGSLRDFGGWLADHQLSISG
ncbi:MAG: HAD family hydrolase [Streptosporangiaceae bacterium]